MVTLNKKFISNLLYKYLIRIRFLDKSKIIYIYDIDNTISKTASYQNFKGIVDKDNVSNFDFFKKITSKIISNYNNGDKIFFFTVRPIYLWRKTYYWLRKIKIKVKVNELFFFQSPTHKVEFLKYLCDNGYKIKFYDDMSYNHENNDIKFYEKEIKILKDLNLQYYDYNYLMKYNKNK